MNDSDDDLARLSGELSAIADEDGATGRAWTGEAALLAARVKHLLERPVGPMAASEASDEDLVKRYMEGLR